MYLEYWGLKEMPFQNTCDPRYLCLSPQHEEALTRLQYAVSHYMACAMLTGIFGSGKTVLAQTLLQNLKQDAYATAFIFNPQLSPVDLLREIVYQLGVHDYAPEDKPDILHRLAEILNDNYSEGRHTVIMVDEAHLIEERAKFEELRLLLNFQKHDKFLLTLILVGQPELKDKISHLKPLDQRVSMRYHLKGLKLEETQQYITHRLNIAGTERNIFSASAIKKIHESSGGIPRRINQICDMALLTGFGLNVPEVSTDVLKEVLMDAQAT